MTIIRMLFSCLNRELNLILFPHQNCLRMGAGVNGYVCELCTRIDHVVGVGGAASSRTNEERVARRKAVTTND